MIAHLRRRHRLMTFALALVAPVIFVVALATRPSPVTHDALADLGNKLDGRAVLLQQHVLRLNAHTLDLSFYGLPRTTEAVLVVEGGAEHASSPPDILVYWQEQEPAGRPSTAAVLLGPWSPGRRNIFDLPADALRGGIVFYSLGHDEIVARQWPIAEGPESSS